MASIESYKMEQKFNVDERKYFWQTNVFVEIISGFHPKEQVSKYYGEGRNNVVWGEAKSHDTN